jgi:hypothetical protein
MAWPTSAKAGDDNAVVDKRDGMVHIIILRRNPSNAVGVVAVVVVVVFDGTGKGKPSVDSRMRLSDPTSRGVAGPCLGVFGTLVVQAAVD